ncbi:MAG: DUF86 domain-containing protein [Selenomonadaceae bacterium]|nr:DUF86 domain-containing protein [Selenomonadaceae bacterium]
MNRVIAEKIIDYCEQIETLIQRFGSTFEAFNSDAAFQLSVGMCIVQIGELTKRFSDEFKARHSQIPWQAIKAMRNVFVHEYEEVNLESTWKDLTEDVPELKAQLEKILEAEGGLDDSQI